MIKKTAFTALIFVLALTLVACSALSSLTAAATSAVPAASDASALESKLAVGILKLENTEQAVTADQAGALLTLWQGVKLLTSDKSASALELAALYQQIQENLTAEQLQAIQQVSWTQDEITAMIKAAGSTVAAQANASTTQKTSSSTTTQSGGPGDMGGGPGGGGPGGNSDLALVSGMSMPSTSTQITSTPIAASTSTKSTLSAGLNAQLANAVIDLLQKRAAA